MWAVMNILGDCTTFKSLFYFNISYVIVYKELWLIIVFDFQRRQEELEKKAQELARKEEELKHAAAGGGKLWYCQEIE